MSIIMFLVGSVIFTLFIVTQIWEYKQEVKRRKKEILDNKYYYERHSVKRNKEPKRKKGSQSRRKTYNNLKST